MMSRLQYCISEVLFWSVCGLNVISAWADAGCVVQLYDEAAWLLVINLSIVARSTVNLCVFLDILVQSRPLCLAEDVFHNSSKKSIVGFFFGHFLDFPFIIFCTEDTK